MNPETLNRKKTLHARDIHSRWRKSSVKRCHYCGTGLTQETATKEHLRTISKGGDDSPTNVVIACKPCNGARGNGDYYAFKAHMLPAKLAREAGEPVPEIPKYTGNKRLKTRPIPRAKMLAARGYTKEILLNCIRAGRMRLAEQTWETIAGHLNVSVKAAKAMATVGYAPPATRIAMSERIGLLALIAEKGDD